MCASGSLSVSHCACAFVKCLSVFVLHSCEPSLARKVTEGKECVFSNKYTAWSGQFRNGGTLINHAVCFTFFFNRQLQERQILRFPSIPSLHPSSLHSIREMNTKSTNSWEFLQMFLSRCKQVKFMLISFSYKVQHRATVLLVTFFFAGKALERFRDWPNKRFNVICVCMMCFVYSCLLNSLSFCEYVNHHQSLFINSGYFQYFAIRKLHVLS